MMLRENIVDQILVWYYEIGFTCFHEIEWGCFRSNDIFVICSIIYRCYDPFSVVVYVLSFLIFIVVHLWIRVIIGMRIGYIQNACISYRLLAFPIVMTTWSGDSHLNRMIFAEKFYHDTLFTLFILCLPLHGMRDIDMFRLLRLPKLPRNKQWGLH
jgi:hypothetical protein